MKRLCLTFILTAIVLSFSTHAEAQHSVARLWNEALLESIRHDFARPTIHARNLFHASLAMYDAWAVYDQVANTYLLGKTVGGFTCKFSGIRAPADVDAARKEALSFAVYRLLTHRFKKSPGAKRSLARFDSLMAVLGYDAAFISTDYALGSPAALGNYLGQSVIAFGLQDGANEQNGYENLHYQPVNPPLVPATAGNLKMRDPNCWQPLTLKLYIDQNGFVKPGGASSFLSPEWGRVTPFALTSAERTTHCREGIDYWVYHDPGTPARFDPLKPHEELSEVYKWTFTLVSVWSSHLDPTDSVMWDISPASIGNVQKLPQTLDELRGFYNLYEGGDSGKGHAVNPCTEQPYQPQIVPRGDYTRVLAEFWADGPTSETPPGHWFTILNYVSDHSDFQKRFRGQGRIVDDLEWDVKSYLALGGAVHDAAIAAWGIKGWYDYVRPISAIRWLADRGQSTNPNLPRYSPIGIPLIPGLIEVVQARDPLAGDYRENVDKIKLYTWRGHKYIKNSKTEVAGVGWILAENWWPYQRQTFVTPPFGGYVSGHSTFSRAAAEVMTLLTGDEYFPGGMAEFHARKNEYLVFEDGPSVNVTLQWATYRDAADQCSLSRIWGGIHPPVDDIPGRLIGKKIGVNAFLLAERYFTGQLKQAASAQTGPAMSVPQTSIDH